MRQCSHLGVQDTTKTPPYGKGKRVDSLHNSRGAVYGKTNLFTQSVSCVFLTEHAAPEPKQWLASSQSPVFRVYPIIFVLSIPIT